jgi:hypothetical protein
VVEYYPERPHIARHPVVRAAMEEEYRESVNVRRKLGMGPPPKGAGNAKRKKK